MKAMGKVDDILTSVVMQAMAVAHMAVSGSSAVAFIIQRFGCIAGAQSNALGWVHANAHAAYVSQ